MSSMSIDTRCACSSGSERTCADGVGLAGSPAILHHVHDGEVPWHVAVQLARSEKARVQCCVKAAEPQGKGSDRAVQPHGKIGERAAEPQGKGGERAAELQERPTLAAMSTAKPSRQRPEAGSAQKQSAGSRQLSGPVAALRGPLRAALAVLTCMGRAVGRPPQPPGSKSPPCSALDTNVATQRLSTGNLFLLLSGHESSMATSVCSRVQP